MCANTNRIETLSSTPPHVRIKISLFYSPAVEEPISTTGDIIIKDGIFSMNIKDGKFQMTVKAAYQGKKNGNHVFFVNDAEGAYNIRLEPTSKYRDLNVIVYFFGDDNMYAVGKIIESSNLQ